MSLLAEAFRPISVRLNVISQYPIRELDFGYFQVKARKGLKKQYDADCRSGCQIELDFDETLGTIWGCYSVKNPGV